MGALGKKLRSMGDKDGNRIGFMHWCPGCDRPHGIWTEARNTKGATWSWNGDVEKPTTTPSVLCQWTQGPNHIRHCCHYFLKAGMIQFCPDSTHALAGQTVPLPDWPEEHKDFAS